MATELLGDRIDLHGGGHDLIFPHHESERAIAKCLRGEEFCRHWVHNGLVTFGREKMSKSLGNYQGLAEAIKEYGAACVRVLYLEVPYRDTLEWRNRMIHSAHGIVHGLHRGLRHAADGEPTGHTARLLDAVVTALRDDLDTPRALDLALDLATDHSDEQGARAALAEVLELLGLATLTPFREELA